MPNLQADLESLLENEALTADLTDEAANVLLEWGMSRVRLIHRLAADETDPEGYIAQQMKATRKLMRAVNNWTATRSEKDSAGNTAALQEVLTHAEANASSEQQTEFLIHHLSDLPPEFIASLRSFSENR